MRIACLLLIGTLLAAETLKLTAPYQSIYDEAQAVPPEFAADAMLRIVESGKIADRDARRKLVEQAFHLGTQAKFPVRMHGLAGTLVDTRSGFLSKAYDLKLDALSLESRAVRDMLAIDAARARELFVEIPRPSLAALTCYDALVYDVGDYYQALGAVVAGAFSAQERKKEEDLKFLLDYLGQASSAAQLPQVARLIKNAGSSAQQRDILMNRFNGMLEGLQPDDRSFTAALEDIRREITPEMQVSFEKFKQKSAGCRDDSRPGVTLQLSQGPVHAGNTPTVERYWESAQAKRLLQDGLKLRFTPDGKIIPESARSTREWQQQLLEYLNQLADWTAGQEKSEADYYHQKCLVYESLVELIPAGPQRDKTIQAFVEFVSNSNVQQQSPVEWFLEARSMLERVHNTNGSEPDKLVDAFENSGNPVLALCAREEKVFGGQAPSWVTKSN